jgi:hypothetical protein
MSGDEDLPGRQLDAHDGSMRFALLALSLVLLGCGPNISGMCNICPNATFVDLSACAEAGKKAGCAKAEIVEVTDDLCDMGKPAQTHQECVFSGCERDFECTMVVQQ